MEPSILEKQILATILWYDFFNFPLTSFEVWQNLIKGKEGSEKTISFRAVEKTIKKSDFLRSKIASCRGFYFFKNSEEIIGTRIYQNKLSIKKWRRLKKIIKIITFIPYVRMVSITGSMSFSHPRKESDLDVLIITAKNRIWLCRFLITTLTQVLGVRRHKKRIKNKICLNHYISEERLEVKGKSLYTAFEYFKMVPVFGFGAYEKFIKKNKWLNNFLVNPKTFQFKNKHFLRESRVQKFFQNFFEILLNNPFGSLLEKILGRTQEARIKKDPLYKKEGGRVRVSRFQLEFHPDSPEKRILERFNREAVKLELDEFIPQKDSGLLK